MALDIKTIGYERKVISSNSTRSASENGGLYQGVELNQKLLTVVIPTLNEEEYSFIFDHPLTEITFVSATPKGPAIARNTGAKHAKGKYIAFFDADTRIHSGLLENAVKEMDGRNIDIGAFFSKPSSKRLDDWFLVYFCGKILFTLMEETHHPLAAGPGIIVRKEFHEAMGGFDPSLTFAEDHYYAQKGKIMGGNFSMLHDYIIFSMRRFDKEGRINLWLKYLEGFLLYLRDDKSDKIVYEFGKFNKES